jgi:hypothetical protein
VSHQFECKTASDLCPEKVILPSSWHFELVGFSIQSFNMRSTCSIGIPGPLATLDGCWQRPAKWAVVAAFALKGFDLEQNNHSPVGSWHCHKREEF